LRYLTPEKHKQFEAIVYGSRSHLGMPPFGGRLEPSDIEKIRAYLVKRAHDLKNEMAATRPATEEKTK
jgi:quinohemoprotein ethanol dehydrogenase